MSAISADIREYHSITEEIKRLNARTRELRGLRKGPAGRIFREMESKGLDEIDGVKKKEVTPLELKPKRLTKVDKRNANARFLRKLGLSNSESLAKQQEDALKNFASTSRS